MSDRESVSEDALEGRYVNHFRVGHNAVEFVVDFGQSYQDQDEAHYHTRIVTSPVYARDLLAILTESIKDFESEFGKIVENS